MTREELNKKKVLLSLNNKKYEKVAHSGTENFLAYRKKVLEGRAKMDALKRQSEMFNVTEANDKHYNDLVNNGMLIHAQNPLYGQQRDNTKYYKREGEPGKYRYYYTKEEYDAAHRTGASSDAEREAKARQQYETNKKIENYKNQNKQETGEAKELGKYEYNQAMNAEIKKFSDIAREGGAAAASKKMLDDGYADDLLYVVKKGLQSGKLTYKDGRFETDDAQLRADIDEESSFLQKRSREVGELSGKGKEIQKELEKLIISEIENLNNKNEARKDNAKNAQSRREAAEKAGQEAEQKRQMDEVKKEGSKLYNDRNELAAEQLSVNNKAAIDDIKMAITQSSGLKPNEVDKLVKEKASKYYSDEDKKKDEDARMALIEKRLALYDEIDKEEDGFNNYKNLDKMKKVQEMGRKIYEMEKDEYNKEIKATLDALEDLMNDPKYGKTAASRLEFNGLLYDITRDLNEYGKNTNVNKQIQEFVDKYYKGAGKKNETTWDNANVTTWDDVDAELDKKAKHSDSNPNTITTSEPLTPEQEYLNFKAKVEAGMKKQETIRHSMFIKSAKKQEAPKPIKPVYDNNKFDFYENVKKFKEEHPNVLSHGQNFKYYNKIDLGNGKSRYFYTKAEWDAYQDGLGKSAYENQKKVNEANKTSGGAKADAAREKADRDAYESMKGTKMAKPTVPNVLSDTDKKELAEKGKKQVMKVQNYDNNKKAAEARELDERQRDLDKYQENNKLTGIYDADKERYSNGRMKKGQGFVDANPETGEKPHILASIFSISLGGADYPLPGTDGHGNKTDYNGYDDEDEERVIKDNKEIIDHCLDFYQTYVLDKGEMDDWDFNREVGDYIMSVVNFVAPNCLRNSDNRLSTAGLGFVKVLEMEIKRRAEQMKKKNNEQKEIDEKKKALKR